MKINLNFILHLSGFGLLFFIVIFPQLVGSTSVVSGSEKSFSIIVLPDTQHYSEDYPWIFDNQTKWIKENVESLNIVFVTHLGDLVNDWWSIDQWKNANHSISILDGSVPFGVLPGNHDGVTFGGDLINYNNYFGFDRFENKSWYGGAYQNINTNSFQFFSNGKDDFLIFHIQNDPNDAVLEWANEVIDRYPNTKVIISTHNYLDVWQGVPLRSSVGTRIWEKLVKPQADQIFLVLSGHFHHEARISSNVNGFFVHQLLSDFQDRDNGGDGWLRIVEFSAENNEFSVKTFSPFLNKFEIDKNSQFVLDNKIVEYPQFYMSSLILFLFLIILIFSLYIIYFIKKAIYMIK